MIRRFLGTCGLAGCILAGPAWAESPGSTLPSSKPGAITVIQLADVRALIAQKAAIIVDARSPQTFAEGHIPGALNCFVDEFSQSFPKVESQLPKDARIILYCDGKDCPMAHDLGEQLVRLNYTNLLYYKNGWEEWAEASKAPVAAAAPAEATTGPTIEFDATEWDFKELDHNAPCVHIFKLKNTGTSTLKILTTHASCGCTVPTMARKEIPAGESEDLKVTYDSKRVGPFSKTVTVVSNDAAHGSIVLHISGNIVTEVMTDPAYGIRWPAPVYRDSLESSPRRLTLRTTRLDELKITKIKSVDPNVTWKIVNGPDARTKYVDFTLRTGTRPGNLNTAVTVETNSKKEPVTQVPLSLEVLGEVQVIPEQINFETLAGGKPSEGRITVRDHSAAHGLAIKGVEDEAGKLDFTVETVRPGIEYTIIAKLKPAAASLREVMGKISIRTNRAGEDSLGLYYSGLLQPVSTK